jgi:hypothetical protein
VLVTVLVKARRASSHDRADGEGDHPEAGPQSGTTHHGQEGVRIKFSAGKCVVTAVPLVEPFDSVDGFWLWQVKSMREAIEWVKRHARSRNEAFEIELHPLFETDQRGAIESRQAACPRARNAHAGQAPQPYPQSCRVPRSPK